MTTDIRAHLLHNLERFVGTSPIEVEIDVGNEQSVQIVKQGYQDLVKILDSSTLTPGKRERLLFRLVTALPDP